MGLAFATSFGKLLAYFAVCAASALLLHRLARVPREVFRKTLHLILVGSVFVFAYAFPTWWAAAAAAAAFAAAVYPLLALAERYVPDYTELLTERRQGEIKSSLVLAFTMFVALFLVCWGWAGERYLVVAAVLAWGSGDAAAALVGTRFGKHRIETGLLPGNKSLEGTTAMFAASFLCVAAVLSLHGAAGGYASLLIAAATAAVTALVELYSRRGLDTLTCPLAAAAVLIALVRLWGV
ncbi:MAG: phosphatidate cytidylyltransferase [Symbiobacterium sp.]|uniref:diacylglycerol/polyprenol kinase family protein n=1 Tax=Symbiobacterium sp. TaxID=1971213 RepID=UPI0034644894